MAEPIILTPEPVRISAAGSNVNQDLRLALDVSTYDELDLLLVCYEMSTGGNITVSILTGMTCDSESSWVTLTSFAATGAATAKKLNVTNFLRYIRYQLTTSSTFTTTFAIDGMARRWAPRDLASPPPTPPPREIEPPGPRWRPSQTSSSSSSMSTTTSTLGRGSATTTTTPDRPERPR